MFDRNYVSLDTASLDASLDTMAGARSADAEGGMGSQDRWMPRSVLDKMSAGAYRMGVSLGEGAGHITRPLHAPLRTSNSSFDTPPPPLGLTHEILLFLL